MYRFLRLPLLASLSLAAITATPPPSPICAACLANPSLPVSGVKAGILENDPGDPGFLTAILSLVPAGSDVQNIAYNAWCADDPNLPVFGSPHAISLFST